jgi:HSP20 family molecular chaperone IbpA
MTRISVFSSPFLLGFDHFERVLDRAQKSANDGYPPYNIEQTAENALRITLAVAGFSQENLTVTIEENQLIIRGKQTDDPNRTYLHRGIAARQFQRCFVLAEGIEVAAAKISNGLLAIDLVRPQPSIVVKTIPIQSASSDRDTLDLSADQGTDRADQRIIDHRNRT